MSNSTLKILPALMVAITAAWLTQPVFGQAPLPTPHQIVITENSSTSLTATFDGSTSGVSVIETSSNNWQVFFPAAVQLTGAIVWGWIEPDNSTTFNEVETNPTKATEMFVLSDGPFSGDITVADGFPITVGTDTADHTPIVATFHDAGDAPSTVPDTGSTFGLLFLALTALLSATRIRSLRLA